MRIGAHRYQRIRRSGHQLGDIAVQVQRDDDRHIRPQLGAQAAQQFALAVFGGLRDHRAVQEQQGAIDFIVGTGKQHVRQGFECFRGDQPGRIGRGDHRVHQRPAELLRRLEATPHGGAGATQCARNFVGAQQAATPEALQVRLDDAEGVGLVRDPACQNALHRMSLHWFFPVDSDAGAGSHCSKAASPSGARRYIPIRTRSNQP